VVTYPYLVFMITGSPTQKSVSAGFPGRLAVSDGTDVPAFDQVKRARAIVVGVCLAVTQALMGASPVGGTGIENATCELIRPGVYRIDYRASSDAGAVQVFASSYPDRLDSTKPVLTIRRTPAEIAVPARSGRVYFHLKAASGITRVVSIRRLPLEGATNFRDLGGYRTNDGHYVRWGTVYRSNHLVNLTARDYEYLDRLHIRLVCDVRTEGDRMRSPTHWMGPAPEFLSVPIGKERDMTLTLEDLRRRLQSQSAPGQPAQNYDQYAIGYAAEFGSILKRLAAGDLPAVEHCSSGKDRSGVFSVVLLTALGVDRETVVQDYLLTNRYTLDADSIAKTAADLQRIYALPQPPDAWFVRETMTTRPETLESTFEGINKTYGSFDSYLRNGLKISESELATLRQRLLEP
jgi:protein-tyrosine phosphatase